MRQSDCTGIQPGLGAADGQHGFVQATLEGEESSDFVLQHPRSLWLRQSLSAPEEQFHVIARAADISHVVNHSYADIAVLAKVLLSADDAFILHMQWRVGDTASLEHEEAT